MKVFALFPGQGSQVVGMGRDFYNEFDIAKELFEIADDVLGFSLKDICFNGPQDELTKTYIAQPAILTVSAITAYVANQVIGDKIDIACAAGHSLGEYSALVVSGAITFQDAVLLVHKRGKFMQEAVPIGKGSMVAVLGEDINTVQNVLNEVKGVCQIANFNAPGQIVLAGDKEGILEFIEKSNGMRIKELQVSAPFHCSLMMPAQEKLAVELENIDINTPKFPVVANFTGKFHFTPEEIKANLINQVSGQVRWVDCVETALAEYKPQCCIEFGSGRVLSGLMKRIKKGFPVFNLSSLKDLEKLSKLEG